MIHLGDCVTVMAGMEPDSVDAIVTDPPYGLEFMGKEWDRLWREGTHGEDNHRPTDEDGRSTGLSRWSGPRPSYKAGASFQAWCQSWATAALRVTKPGGYLLAFGGTRTHHRLVCGLEDAGWIIRDELDWIYASGFPKGKANLKPAHEPIVLARKPGPLRPLGIDAGRIGVTGGTTRSGPSTHLSAQGAFMTGHDIESIGAGRWPSNVLLSDPELFDAPNPEVVGSGAVSDGKASQWHLSDQAGKSWLGTRDGQEPGYYPGYDDSGGYSRYFLIPKADRADREPVLRGQLAAQDVFRGHQPDNPKCLVCGKQRIGPLGAEACSCQEPEWAVVGDKQRENAHPTVKPVDLMRHLVRLVTPIGGTVLDPFLGSGSTAIAATLEGFAWIGIEKEPEYVAIAEARLNGTQVGMAL